MAELCWPCRRNQHDGCIAALTNMPCDCTHEVRQAPVAQGSMANAMNLEPDSPDSENTTRVRRHKSDDSVTDQQSTGRKRAAKAFPLIVDGNRLPCDYRNKKNCLPNYMEVQIDGCGIRPSTMPGSAQSRHHNDYNTLNNERENVALLCHSCHNLLHARNDPFKDVIYERIYGFKPQTDDLKHANKALKSGVVKGGVIQDKEKDEEV